MDKLKNIFSLFIFLSCSSVHFTSSNNTPIKFDFTDDTKTEVSIVVSKPFYLWGLAPDKQVVFVDQVFQDKGYGEVTDLRISEVEQNKKAMWMFFTFGMYYPQAFKLTGKVN